MSGGYSHEAEIDKMSDLLHHDTHCFQHHNRSHSTNRQSAMWLWDECWVPLTGISTFRVFGNAFLRI